MVKTLFGNKNKNENKNKFFNNLLLVFKVFVICYIFHLINLFINYSHKNYENFQNEESEEKYIYFINNESSNKLFLSSYYLDLINNYRLSVVFINYLYCAYLVYIYTRLDLSMYIDR